MSGIGRYGTAGVVAGVMWWPARQAAHGILGKLCAPCAWAVTQRDIIPLIVGIVRDSVRRVERTAGSGSNGARGVAGFAAGFARIAR
jgi:hypothetical protein